MAREARRRCRCGEGRGKDVGLDRREEDAGARGAEKMSGREARKRCRGEKGAKKMPMQGPETAARVPAAGQKGVEKKGTLFFHNMQ